ncbi:MAG: hypothetical protein JOZ75_00765 [Candidatus Dormibacteraeota bacterium]|nr:hypothetical protein [Candidatus Dormibacteraeota bacterium]
MRSLISAHFGHGLWVSANEVHYSSIQGGDAALKFRYDGRGLLKDILAGPALDECSLSQVLDAVESERSPSRTDLVRNVLFAAVPTRSRWSFADSAAILPVPPGSPEPQEVVADYPFILEVRYQTSARLHLRSLRRRRALRRWELLLCVLVGWGIHSLGPMTTKRWVLVATQEDLSDMRSEFLQVGYHVPDYHPPYGALRGVGAAPMFSVPDEEFYSRRGISADQVMSVPDSLPMALQRYSFLSVGEQRDFLRACYWFQLSERQWELSQSASYQSLVQSIEALLPRRIHADTCTACGRPVQGPTRAFKDFVETYAAWTTSAERNGFYDLRSSVAHGAVLFESDGEIDFGGMHPLRWQQYQTHGRMAQVARIALVNYLLAR